jgi:hypothetical protein
MWAAFEGAQPASENERKLKSCGETTAAKWRGLGVVLAKTTSHQWRLS